MHQLSHSLPVPPAIRDFLIIASIVVIIFIVVMVVDLYPQINCCPSFISGGGDLMPETEDGEETSEAESDNSGARGGRSRVAKILATPFVKLWALMRQRMSGYEPVPENDNRADEDAEAARTGARRRTTV